MGAEKMQDVMRLVLLRTIDRLWVGHLTEMDSFRQGVGLQAYGQQDPLVTYKREAFDMFDQLTDGIRHESVRALTHIQVTRNAPEAPTSAGAAGRARRGPRGTGARGRSRRAAVPAAAVVSTPAAESAEAGSDPDRKLSRQQRRALKRRQEALGVAASGDGAGTAAEAVGVQTISERHGDETDPENAAATSGAAAPGGGKPRGKKRKKRRR